MNKNLYITVVVAVCSIFLANAQQSEFAPVGTQWYYGMRSYSPTTGQRDYYVLIESTGDTIIDGKTCKILTNKVDERECYTFWSFAAAYQSNDTVYFYGSGSDPGVITGTIDCGFYPVYIWNAQADATWQTLNGVTVRVDSVEVVTLFGQTLKKQFLTYTDAAYHEDTVNLSYTAEVLENIGDLYYLYGFAVNNLYACDEMAYSPGIRCYVSPAQGTYSFSDVACDYTTALSENEMPKVIVTDDRLLLPEAMLSATTKIQIFNPSGQNVKFLNVVSSNEIDISDLEGGIYFVRITDNQSFKSFKLVKL